METVVQENENLVVVHAALLLFLLFRLLNQSWSLIRFDL